jgi:succinyl-diaminopimelate desuccinylase
MDNYILGLSKKFISIKSDPDNKAELDKILSLALSELSEYSVERFEHNGSKSALVYNTKTLPKKFKVLLNCHLDIIPGKDFQYSPYVEGDRLYGVGSMDMKANVACAINVFREISDKVNYPLGLQLVTDEETGGFDGTKYQIENGVRSDFVISTEPTKLNVANKAKGVLWIKITSKGKTAHGAYPWKGKNAVWAMNDFLLKISEKFPVPSKQTWVTTVNLSKIETSNNSFNKIPDNCIVWFDIRYIPKDKNTILNEVKSLMPKEFKLEVITFEPELDVNEKNIYLQLLKRSAREVLKRNVRFYGAQGSSDARHFTRVGCPGVEFGPLGSGIGTDSEYVSISSLENYRKILTDFLLSVDKL